MGTNTAGDAGGGWWRRTLQALERSVGRGVEALNARTARFLRPLTRRAGKRFWWVFVAGGVLLLAVSSVAMKTLGAQLELMHPRGGPGFAVQGYSLSHLTDAIATWKAWAAGSEALGMASPRGIAVTWILVDLVLFVTGYAAAGGMLLVRASRPGAGGGQLRAVWRAAASLLVVVVALDLLENLLSLAAVVWWPDTLPRGLAAAVGVVTWTKTIAGAPVVLAGILLGIYAWRSRSQAATATTSLLRGQIGIALATVVFFSLPIQLPDVFLSLRAIQLVALCVAAALLSLATWSTARWMVVRREERTGSDAAGLKRVLAAAAVALAALSLVNLLGDGNALAPLVPPALLVAIAVLGVPLDKGSGPAQPVTDLGRSGVFVPQALAAIGVTVAGGAAITAVCLLAVANGRLWLVPLVIAATVAAVTGMAAVVFRLEHRISGTAGRARTWRAAPETTKAALLEKASSDERLAHRSAAVGRIVAVTAAATLLAVLWLLFDRVGNAQTAGAAAAVILFLAAATLVLGGIVVAADAWDQLVGVPPALDVMGFARIPAFTLLLVWALVGASLDDGRHWDVRKIPGTAHDGVSLDTAFETWTGAADPLPAEDGGRAAIPLVIVATSGGGIRSAYWTSLALDCLFAGRAAEEWRGSNPCGSDGGDRPGPADVFLGSGISGGSLGLVSWDTSLDEAADAGWVDEKLGEDFVAPTVAWGLLVEVPRSFLHFPADDRAEVLEESWETPWADGDDPSVLAEGFLASQEGRPGARPLLLLNGDSVFDGCALNVSLLDAGSSIDEGTPEASPAPAAPVADGNCLAPGRYADDDADADSPGPLPATVDLVDYLGCEVSGETAMHDIRRSTAALLSARFPYVSPAGRLIACDDETSIKFVLDGGIVDTSAAEAAIGIYLGLEPLIEHHNATNPDTCVVPYFVQIDNDYDPGPSPQRDVKPPNQLLAPVLGLNQTTGLSSRAARARALAAEMFTRPFPTGPKGTAPVTTPRHVRILPRRHPGVEAPLGWVLSRESRDDLERQLYEQNDEQIRGVKEWFSQPAACEDAG